MRIAVAFGILFSVLTLAPTQSQAQTYPWCAHYGGRGGGGTNCGFSTLAQCQAAISGVGGYCARNPFYYGSRRDRDY
jgi:hypothetical protein